jgi:hypothetical protein
MFIAYDAKGKVLGDTKVQTAVVAQLKDLKAGTSVTIQGTSGDSNTVTATLITAGK